MKSLLLSVLVLTSVTLAKEPLPFVGELPGSYLCMITTQEFDTEDVSKTTARMEMYVVSSNLWRLEVVSDNSKDLIVTFDGTTFRSSLSAIAPDRAESLSPKTYFSDLFSALKKGAVLSRKPASLDGMTCERVSLEVPNGPLDAWLHSETRLPVQFAIKGAKHTLIVQRLVWVRMPDLDVYPENMQAVYYGRFSGRINDMISRLPTTPRPSK